MKNALKAICTFIAGVFIAFFAGRISAKRNTNGNGVSGTDADSEQRDRGKLSDVPDSSGAGRANSELGNKLGKQGSGLQRAKEILQEAKHRSVDDPNDDNCRVGSSDSSIR